MEGLNCSICFEHFQNPVTLLCGHTFCQACIGGATTRRCPLCKQHFSTIPAVNLVLRDIIESSKLISDTNVTEVSAKLKASDPTAPFSQLIGDSNVREVSAECKVSEATEPLKRSVGVRTNSQVYVVFANMHGEEMVIDEAGDIHPRKEFEKSKLGKESHLVSQPPPRSSMLSLGHGRYCGCIRCRNRF